MTPKRFVATALIAAALGLGAGAAQAQPEPTVYPADTCAPPLERVVSDPSAHRVVGGTFEAGVVDVEVEFARPIPAQCDERGVNGSLRIDLVYLEMDTAFPPDGRSGPGANSPSILALLPTRAAQGVSARGTNRAVFRFQTLTVERTKDGLPVTATLQVRQNQQLLGHPVTVNFRIHAVDLAALEPAATRTAGEPVRLHIGLSHTLADEGAYVGWAPAYNSALASAYERRGGNTVRVNLDSSRPDALAVPGHVAIGGRSPDGATFRPTRHVVTLTPTLGPVAVPVEISASGLGAPMSTQLVVLACAPATAAVGPGVSGGRTASPGLGQVRGPIAPPRFAGPNTLAGATGRGAVARPGC